MLSNGQKRIYNLYMLTYRKARSKFYKFRENFDDYESEHEEDYLALVKLEKFLNTYSNVNIKTFLKAPYVIYNDVDFFKLKFYTSQKAIKCYNIYLKQLENELPDSKDQLEFINESLIYIKEFCLENKLDIQSYLKHRKGISLTWMVDIISSKVSPYVIVGLSYFNIYLENLIADTPVDECEMFLKDLTYNYTSYKTKLNNSTNAKKLIINGLTIINKQLKNNSGCDKILSSERNNE